MIKISKTTKLNYKYHENQSMILSVSKIRAHMEVLKMKKRSVATVLILCLFVVMLFSGCSKDDGNETGDAAGGGTDTTQSNDASTDSSEATESDNGPSGEVMLYSSMQEAQLKALKDGFTAKYPNIKMDYYFAGTGKVVTKIATENQSGQVAADVIWVGDPGNYISFKEKGILAQYESPEAENIGAKFKDPEGYYTGARLVVAGFGYNTNLVTPEEAPKTWDDLLKPEWKDQIIITDPGSSGTSFYAISALLNHEDYGFEFFEKLKEHGAELESGTTATHNKIAAGAYKVGLCLDYVSKNLAKDGATIGFKYPEENLISITSPIALIEGAANEANGKLLYDYILSTEGQQILLDNNLNSVRSDMSSGEGMTIPEIEEASLPVDDKELAEKSKNILEQFDKIFK